MMIEMNGNNQDNPNKCLNQEENEKSILIETDCGEKNCKCGKLLVISGPSGVGKTEVALNLRAYSPIYVKAITSTTRKKREGETHGVDYFFVTLEEFEKMKADGNLLEWTVYNGNCYGTPKHSVEKALSCGKIVILVIDVAGALNIKKMFPEAVMCFLNAESLDAIERRLRRRGTDSEEAIKGRLSVAQSEINSKEKFDFEIMNREGKLESAVFELHQTIQKLMG